jgi:hypothetical protein
MTGTNSFGDIGDSSVNTRRVVHAAPGRVAAKDPRRMEDARLLWAGESNGDASDERMS